MHIKRYLGSAITAFSAVAIPVFMCGSIYLAVIVLSSEFSIATFLISVMCLSCCVLWGMVLYRNKRNLYSWGIFKDDGVLVFGLFQERVFLRYDQCRSVGIGLYRHAFLNSTDSVLGTKIVFIFLAEDLFSEKYRTHINKWHPSSKSIKVKYDSELYSFLIEKLPKKKAQSLIHDYEFFINLE